MSLRNLPTDNLYKFLAIAGLIIAFGTPTLIQKRVDQLEKFLAEQNVALLVIQKEISILDGKKESEASGQNIQLYAYKPDPTMRLPMGNTEARALFTPPEWHSIYTTAKIQLEEDTKITASKKQRGEYVSLFVFMLGLGFSTFGFYKWYDKIQRHMDTIWELKAKQTTP